MSKILDKLKAIVGLKEKIKSDEEMQAENAERVFKEAKAAVEDKTSSDFDKFIANAEKSHIKFVKNKQWLAASKLAWLIKVAKVERHLESIGITKCISTDALQDLMRRHPSRVLKIIDVASYEREIPDEISQLKEQLADVFDEFLVLYTDYSISQQVKDANNGAKGEVEKYRTSYIRRDPILFGMFVEDVKIGKAPEEGERDIRQTHRLLGDRLYLIGDWEDEFCNLTFTRMMSEAARAGMRFNESAHLYVDKAGKFTEERVARIKDIKNNAADALQTQHIGHQGRVS